MLYTDINDILKLTIEAYIYFNVLLK